MVWRGERCVQRCAMHARESPENRMQGTQDHAAMPLVQPKQTPAAYSSSMHPPSPVQHNVVGRGAQRLVCEVAVDEVLVGDVQRLR